MRQEDIVFRDQQLGEIIHHYRDTHIPHLTNTLNRLGMLREAINKQIEAVNEELVSAGLLISAAEGNMQGAYTNGSHTSEKDKNKPIPSEVCWDPERSAFCYTDRPHITLSEGFFDWWYDRRAEFPTIVLSAADTHIMPATQPIKVEG